MVISGLVVAQVCGCDRGAGPANPQSMPLTIKYDSRPWSGPQLAGIQMESEHYRIYTTAQRQLLRGAMPGYMEAAYENYLKLTGLGEKPLGHLLPVYVMGSRSQWSALTQHIFGDRSQLYLSIEAGGFCHRGVCVLWDIGGHTTLSVAAHEGLHQFLHHRLEGQLPMWAEEGLCVSAEGFEINAGEVTFTPAVNNTRLIALRKVIVQNRWRELPRLLPMDAGDIAGEATEYAVGYYAQLWALVQFIRSRGDYRAGFERMLADAQAGELHRALKYTPRRMKSLRRSGRAYNRVVSGPLFEHYISSDLERFDRQYKNYASLLAGLK